MSYPLTEGVKLECSEGTAPAPLQVTSQKFSKLDSKLRATEKDKQAGANIIPFGLCKLKPSSSGLLPCTPSLVEWLQTSPFSVGGHKGLTPDSYCMCKTGGRIYPPSKEGNFEKVG